MQQILKKKVIEPEMVECSDCGENHEIDDSLEIHDSEIICQDCYDNSYFTCESCNDIHHIDHSYTSPSDSYYCEDCRYDCFTYCDDCEDSVWYDDANESEDGETFCDQCYEQGNHGDMYPGDFIENSPDSPKVGFDKTDSLDKLNVDRLVGVEAERVFGDCDVDEEGSPMALGNTPHGWKTAYDGSISGNGREMISIPSNGNILYDRLKSLENWAKEYNVYINKSCGLHVHFDATDTKWRDLRAISLVMLKVEQHIYDMLPPSRQGSNWCKRIDISRLLNCKTESEFIELWYEDYNINRDKYNDSRYHGLNIHARFYLGTIEFRYHSGTLNFTKISNWIKICNSIMETGLRLSRDDSWDNGRMFYHETNEVRYVDGDGTRIDQKLSSLDELLSHMVNIDKSTVRYMIDRMKKFTPNSDIFKNESDNGYYLLNNIIK